MEIYFKPSPSSSRPGSAAAISLSKEEEIPRPGSSIQGGQPAHPGQRARGQLAADLDRMGRIQSSLIDRCPFRIADGGYNYHSFETSFAD